MTHTTLDVLNLIWPDVRFQKNDEMFDIKKIR